MEIMVDGVKVEGEITQRLQKTLRVKITSPYQGWEDTAWLPTGMGLGGWWLYQRHPEYDFTKEYGDTEAVKVLERLYRLCKFVEENQEMLQERLKNVDVGLVDLGKKCEELYAQRQELRAKLKSGEMDNKVYQKQVGPINKELKNLEWAQRSVWNQFYQCFPPNGVPRAKLVEAVNGDIAQLARARVS